MLGRRWKVEAKLAENEKGTKHQVTTPVGVTWQILVQVCFWQIVYSEHLILKTDSDSVWQNEPCPTLNSCRQALPFNSSGQQTNTREMQITS